MAREKAQENTKRKVMRNMFQTCKKLTEINQIFSQVTTEHYKKLCKGLLNEWQNLLHERVQRRQSLLSRQQKFQVKRFIGKLRVQT